MRVAAARECVVLMNVLYLLCFVVFPLIIRAHPVFLRSNEGNPHGRRESVRTSDRWMQRHSSSGLELVRESALHQYLIKSCQVCR